MIDQKIINKLQKLLALSASDNENEAAVAMGMAEALMKEHNVALADVALDGSEARVESEVVVGRNKRAQTWETWLGTEIAHTFHGQAICSKRADGWIFTFIAGKTDLIIILDLYERLKANIARMSKNYVDRVSQTEPTNHNKLYHSYRMGVVYTIKKRLAQLKKNTEPNEVRNAYAMTGKDLMVIKDRAVDQHANELFPRIKKSHSRSTKVHSDAFEQGEADGRKMSLHRAFGTAGGGPLHIGN
jgi:hypothetical protein